MNRRRGEFLIVQSAEGRGPMTVEHPPIGSAFPTVFLAARNLFNDRPPQKRPRWSRNDVKLLAGSTGKDTTSCSHVGYGGLAQVGPRPISSCAERLPPYYDRDGGGSETK